MLIRKNNKKDEKKQLDLELKFSRFEIFYRIRRFSRQIEKQFTALPFWRNGLIWLAIGSIVGVTIITTLIIGKHYLNLPQEVPIIYNTLEGNWKSYPKIFLFFVPLVFVLVGILNIQILQRAYYMNKKLTLMICFLISVTYFLGLIAVNEIIIICTS